MTLETKLNYISSWQQGDALKCWVKFHDLWENKYRGRLFQALTDGTHNNYIQLECETFKRYARMWHYKNYLKYRHMDD